MSGELKSVRDAYDRLVGAKGDNSQAWPSGELQSVRDAYDAALQAAQNGGGKK